MTDERAKLRETVLETLTRVVDGAIESGMYHWEIEQWADEIMAAVDQAQPQWVAVTPETPLPTGNPALVALLPRGRQWAPEFVDNLNSYGRSRAQWWCSLPSAPPLPAPPEVQHE
jgi:hypothetical protein